MAERPVTCDGISEAGGRLGAAEASGSSKPAAAAEKFVGFILHKGKVSYKTACN